MSVAATWRWCLVAGLLLLAASAGFGRIAGLTPCGPSGGLGAILAFELARSPAEVAALFGAEPCRSTLVAAQLRALLLDGLLFIPAYAAFLIFAARALDGRLAARFAVAAVLLAAVLDEVEGVLLYLILRTLPGNPGVLLALYWEARAKFVLLALASFVLAFLLAANRRLGAAAAIPIALGALFSLWFALVDMHAPQMMLGYRVSWAALLVVAALSSLWPRAFARSPLSAS